MEYPQVLACLYNNVSIFLLLADNFLTCFPCSSKHQLTGDLPTLRNTHVSVGTLCASVSRIVHFTSLWSKLVYYIEGIVHQGKISVSHQEQILSCAMSCAI